MAISLAKLRLTLRRRSPKPHEKRAWVDRRRGRYFVGPTSRAAGIGIIGPPPYYALQREASAEEIGRAARAALDASRAEDMSWEDAKNIAEARAHDVARLAGIKDLATYERGTYVVHLGEDDRGEILVTPNHRRRGYWEPAPERYWQRLQRPSPAELGEAILAALEIATA